RGQSLARGCMVEVMRVLRSSDNAPRLGYCRATVPLVVPFVVLPITWLVAGVVPAIVPPPLVLMPVPLSVISVYASLMMALAPFVVTPLAPLAEATLLNRLISAAAAADRAR